MTTSRSAIFAIYVLVALSMWSPDAETIAAGTVVLGRYALFVSTSMAIVLHTYADEGYRHIPLARLAASGSPSCSTPRSPCSGATAA